MRFPRFAQPAGVLRYAAGLFLAMAVACSGSGGGGSHETPTAAPVFTTQPADQIVAAGQPATFTVAASGTPAPSCAWEKSTDGGNSWASIGGASGATYSFTTAVGDDGAQFRATAANGVGTATTSRAATLTVHWAPVFTTQPASHAVTSPAAATFTVAVNANPTATLQWQSSPDGATWTDLPGATSASHATGATRTRDNGRQFRCVATNTVSSANSDPATLAVNAGVGLVLTITGLTGLEADVTLAGPGGYSCHLTATETLSGLDDGTYTITAATVTDPSQPGLGRGNGGPLGPANLQRYPLIPVQSVTVSGGLGAVAVDYPPATLTLQIPKKENASNTVPIDFVLVPAGSFTMGSSYFSDAKPTHVVTIAEAFYLAKTELTQGQWKAVMGATNNPSGFMTGDTYPVEQVSWDDIRAGGTAFLPTLNTALPGYGLRLPSDAEWEYACRAGSTSAYFFGDDHAGLGTYAVYATGATATVGSKAPNAWGLYDILGNVIEFTEDDYHDGYTGAPADGSPWVDTPRNIRRMARGGSWFNSEDACRSAFRGNIRPGDSGSYVGFRVVLSAPRTP